MHSIITQVTLILLMVSTLITIQTSAMSHRSYKSSNYDLVYKNHKQPGIRTVTGSPRSLCPKNSVRTLLSCRYVPTLRRGAPAGNVGPGSR